MPRSKATLVQAVVAAAMTLTLALAVGMVATATHVQANTTPCVNVPLGGACSARCPCAAPWQCSNQATNTTAGKCSECVPDKMYNCLSSQKCLDDGSGVFRCMFVVCGNPPKKDGDSCGDVCTCPGSMACSSGKCRTKCAANAD